jgi:hypothetical protein
MTQTFTEGNITMPTWLELMEKYLRDLEARNPQSHLRVF